MNLTELTSALHKAHEDNSTGKLSDKDLKQRLKEIKTEGPELGTIEFNKLNKEIQLEHPCQRLRIFLERPTKDDFKEADKLEEDAQERLRAKKLKQNGGKRLETEFSRKEKLNK